MKYPRIRPDTPKATRKSILARICPPMYTVPVEEALLPAPDLFAHCNAWQYGRFGLLLTGPTRAGKTRMVWHIVRREILDNCRDVRMYDALGFSTAISRAFGNPDITDDWLDEQVEVDLLVLDDIGKAKFTEAFESALYAIIERRISWERPTIITTNATGKQLQERMTDAGAADRAAPLFARLTEWCHVVTVNTQMEVRYVPAKASLTC